MYTHNRRQSTDHVAYDRFNRAVDSIDQNKYLAPRNFYPFVDEFIIRLNEVKK